MTESVKLSPAATSVRAFGWVTMTGAETVAPLLDEELLELDEELEELELEEEELLLDEEEDELELDELLDEELLFLSLPQAVKKRQSKAAKQALFSRLIVIV